MEIYTFKISKFKNINYMIVYVNITKTLHYRVVSFLWYLYFILFCLILFKFSMEIGNKKWPYTPKYWQPFVIVSLFLSMAPLQSSNGGEKSMQHHSSSFYNHPFRWCVGWTLISFFPCKHKRYLWCNCMCFFVKRTEDVCFSPSFSLFNSMSSL